MLKYWVRGTLSRRLVFRYITYWTENNIEEAIPKLTNYSDYEAADIKQRQFDGRYHRLTDLYLIITALLSSGMNFSRFSERCQTTECRRREDRIVTRNMSCNPNSGNYLLCK